MELSIFLAKVLGCYFLIVSGAALFNRPRLVRLAEEFSQNLALTYLASFLAVILGLLLVVSHNVWAADWRVIITIAGWLALLKGTVLMISPASVAKWAGWVGSPMMVLLQGVAVLLGGYLAYVGFLA